MMVNAAEMEEMEDCNIRHSVIVVMVDLIGGGGSTPGFPWGEGGGGGGRYCVIGDTTQEVGSGGGGSFVSSNHGNEWNTETGACSKGDR